MQEARAIPGFTKRVVWTSQRARAYPRVNTNLVNRPVDWSLIMGATLSRTTADGKPKRWTTTASAADPPRSTFRGRQRPLR